jgi:hypothetical protein
MPFRTHLDLAGQWKDFRRSAPHQSEEFRDHEIPRRPYMAPSQQHFGDAPVAVIATPETWRLVIDTEV